tara:strand:- start:2134 stop:2532 length:399 start_codon:yes stop_codon:yes gene_type:complete
LTVQGNALSERTFLDLLPSAELNAEQKESVEQLLEAHRDATRRIDQRHSAMVRAFRRAVVAGDPSVDEQMATLIRMEAERLVKEAQLGEQIRDLLTPAQIEQIVSLLPQLNDARSTVGSALQTYHDRDHLVF